MKCQILFAGENKKKILKYCLLKFYPECKELIVIYLPAPTPLQTEKHLFRQHECRLVWAFDVHRICCVTVQLLIYWCIIKQLYK